jgi:peptidoglycan-associated lipoprotein
MKFKLLIVAWSALFLMSACRSRTTPQPTTVPPEPAEPVVSAPAPVTPDPGFQQPAPPEEGLPSDLAELNRLAHERGWLRDAFYSFDDARLDQDAMDALTASAQWLADNPDYNLVIEGHCDERGTENYNLALGERRAGAAADFLAARGIDRSRMRTVSYGEERPFQTGADETAWAQNRRAHLILTR